MSPSPEKSPPYGPGKSPPYGPENSLPYYPENSPAVGRREAAIAVSTSVSGRSR